MPEPHLYMTLLEATAVSLAIHNAYGDDQDLEALFGPDRRLWAAALRAGAKLDHLLQQFPPEPSDGPTAD